MSGLVGCKTSTGKRRECCGGLPKWEASYIVEGGTEGGLKLVGNLQIYFHPLSGVHVGKVAIPMYSNFSRTWGTILMVEM